VTAGAGSSAQDGACWQEAARLRREHRGWVVIWLAAEDSFRAYRRLPGARHDTALSAGTAAQMADLIQQAEQPIALRAGEAPCRAQR
jgi:hypothetical protein